MTAHKEVREEVESILEARKEARRLTDQPSLNAMAAAERVLKQYGLATLLALAFFWWVTSDVSGTIRNVRDVLNEHVSSSTFYSRQICLNTARDEAARAGCTPPPASKH